MKFTIQREAILKPLQMVIGAIENRPTIPILANVLLDVKPETLSLSATDMEIELVARVPLTNSAEPGILTVPAKKLLDICRALPEQCVLDIYFDSPFLKIRAGRAQFNLSFIPADDFPTNEIQPSYTEFSISQKKLHYLISSTAFSMGQNDVRYYLNGLSLQVESNHVRFVATDGHRLATVLSETASEQMGYQVIIPRKGVLELSKLLSNSDEIVRVLLTGSTITIITNEFTFSSKLIDAKYPDYNKVIPRAGDKQLVINIDILKSALMRVSILSNEKFRGIRLQLSRNSLFVSANNPDQEEAEEILEIDYQQEDLSIAFNGSYMLDVLSHAPAGDIRITFKDAVCSMLMEPLSDSTARYVIMPMRL